MFSHCSKTFLVSWHKLFLLVLWLVGGVLFLMGTSLYSTIRIVAAPSVYAPIEQSTPLTQTVTVGNKPPTSPPFLNIVPSADGSEVVISTPDNEHLPGLVFANVIGPTGDKKSWTMPYSKTVQSHIVSVPAFSPTKTEKGSVNITSTAGLNSANIQFNRAYVKAELGASTESVDSRIKLELINPNTLNTNTYMVVTTNRTQPGPLLPTNLAMLGFSYSIRAAGQLSQTSQPMILTFLYGEVLQGADPRTLNIYHWEPSETRWRPLDASLSLRNQALSAETKRFGTFALMSEPAWATTFSNLESLGSVKNLLRAGPPTARVLALAQMPGVGSGLSIPITPTFGVESWGALYYTATMNAPTTTLTVDVLGVDDNEPLLSNVASGQSLAGIDAGLHPALRLRVHMSSTLAGASPALSAWRVTWQPPRPAVLSIGNADIELGSVVTVPVDLLEAPSGGLRGAAVEVQYDPAVLQPVQCNITAPSRVTPVCNLRYAADGSLPHSVRFNLIAAPVITTSTQLAMIRFSTVGWAERNTQLELGSMLLTHPNGEPVAVVALPGRLTFTSKPEGDVDCNEQVDENDARQILEYDAGVRQQAMTCPPPADALFLPQCDVTGDGACDLRDAQAILP